MRVVLIANSVTMGGVEEHVRQIAAGLHERGAHVALVMPEDAAVDPLAASARAAGASVVRLTLAWQTHRFGSVRRFFRLVRLLRWWQPDACHMHLVGFTGGRWIVLAAHLARVPRILCTMQVTPSAPQGWRVRLDRALLGRWIDRYIAVSEVCRHRLVAYLGLPAANVDVVPNAVELALFAGPSEPDRQRVRAEHGIPFQAPIVGVPARLSEQKGLVHLLDAMPAILAEHPDTHLLIVGDGPLRDALAAQAAALGVAPRVHFVGYRSNTTAYLRAMDVFALPSLYEGLPLSVLEAMAAGLPVVATHVDGTPEAVEEGRTAILVPPADAHALARAVNALLGDRPRAAMMAQAGRARAASFSTAALLDRLALVYVSARTAPLPA
jgi:glycosyltransferase involved in cell wall biosynthesis